ncbi:hypothetical protein [Pleionea sediminis]|uniref:hypothetical protein n=1 Tax=Pleionea sediminis TaxID=2569479 RepID=UPI00197BC11E|nr:hypothetical protein [Pleionea sediminis]
MSYSSGLNKNSIFIWLAVATGILLLIPLFAMKITDSVNWSVLDFMVMGTLLFSSGSLFIFLARKMVPQKRVYLALTILMGFLYVWAELAVGILFNFGN